MTKDCGHARTAARIDYQSPMTVATEPWLMLFAGNFAGAVAKGEEVAKRFAESAPAHVILGHAYFAVGATAKAIQEYRRTLDIEFLPEALASLGFIDARMGRRKEALDYLAAIHQAKDSGKIAYVSSYFTALIYTGLGEKRKALDALDSAFEEKCDWMIYLAVEPRWEEIRAIATEQEMK